MFAGPDRARPVRVRVNKRSRNYRLSISGTGHPQLSVPPSGVVAEAQSFLDKHRHWLAARLDRRGPPVAFVHGATLPLRGIEHRIEGTGQLRGLVKCTKQDETLVLQVPGGEAHLARRLTDWLKNQASGDLEKASLFHAGRLKVQFDSIRIRSQSSRWGSCSSSGRLNYNWRLVLAPPFVLDYVAAHEVAHLCEMNHSQRFWSRVRETLPDMARGRNWLKANGSDLMRYGVTRCQTTD